MRNNFAGTLDERAKVLEDYLERRAGNEIRGLANHFGKDAMMAVLLRWLELDKRDVIERLAEIAFDLVPGQISEVHKVKTRRVIIPRVDELVGYQESGAPSLTPLFRQVTFELREWRAQSCFAYDDKTGTLFTYGPTARGVG